ncbi:hypothetical protein [Cytobacillus horneckiae]|uniref:hypothetical protein n=1 Tax=Cytobacillus horneckiae TaxID=549687 RepID=UPI003D9A813B
MMEIKKRQRVTLDLRKDSAVPTPTFVQNDTNILEFIIKDNGADADLSNVDNITVTFKRQDGTITTTKLTQVGNVITYQFGFEEMAIPGHGELSIQFFQGNNRLSSNNLKVYFAKSLSTEFEESAGMPILQELFIEVATVTENAIDAGNYALEQAAEADQQAKFAKTQGDRAKAEADRLQGTDVSKLDQQVRTINEQLTASNRHHQILSQGQHILNGSQSAPLDIQIEGRTLIPMQNTVLDAAKFYVLADKKTGLKWADNTVTQGIAKFTGKAEKPRVIKVTNFERKVAGSTVENPHFAVSYSSSNLVSTTIAENFTQNRYNDIFSLNGSSTPTSTQNNGQLPQQLFSFNLIEEVERTIGRIPRTTVADKVQWLKDNVVRLACNWYGFGSAVTGNKASLAMWNSFSNFWNAAVSTSSSTVAKLAVYSTTISERVDAKGFVHFLAYGEPSDGATPSIINTDYVDFEIEFKTTATLHDPCIPLYEVDRAEYDKILASYDEIAVLARYPRVQGMQHLQNPYVIAEGENLLPPFYEWTLHANAIIIGPYEVELNATGAYQSSHVRVNVKGNQQYSFLVEGSGGNIWEEKVDGTSNGGFSFIAGTQRNFITKVDTARLRIELTQSASGKFNWKNPMLNLGAATKPFVSRNPSHLFANVKLGQIGDKKDTLFRDNGEWKMWKEIARDVVLDGSLPWVYTASFTSSKRIRVLDYPSNRNSGSNGEVIKHNGKVLKKYSSDWSSPDMWLFNGAHFDITIDNEDSGWSDAYTTLTSQEIKAYFNGWKVKLIDLNGKPTAWQSVVDGKDAPTQTLAYVSANLAPNYTPYKLSYALASPVTEVVTEKVEGDIAINGLTQVDVGSGIVVREKVVPFKSVSTYEINHAAVQKLKYRVEKFIAIYKNNVLDNTWRVGIDNDAYGKVRLFNSHNNVDATAEYTVTYLALDRHLFTTNPVSIPVSWAGSLKGTVTDVVNKQADDRAQISVNTRLIYDVLLRLKAGGL